jgi:maleate isomerase
MSAERGRIGLIKPTHRAKSFAFWYKNLPDGLECVPTFIGFRKGTRATFTAETTLRRAEELATELREVNCDIISVSGTPPFLLRGHTFEQEWGRALSLRLGIPVATPMQPHAAALKALGVKRTAVATYYREELNDAIVRYFSAFGIDSAVIPGFSASSETEELYATPLMALDEVSGEQVYRHCTDGVRRLEGAVEALYINGGGWEVAPVIERLERDLGIPVVWALAAEMWVAFRTLGVDDAIANCGVLLRTPGLRIG